MAEYIRKDVLTRVYMEKGKDKLRLATVINELEMLPAADVAPVVHGKWVYGEDVDIQCSVCGVDALTEGDYRQVKSRYCPNCGAKMDLRGENDDGTEKA